MTAQFFQMVIHYCVIARAAKQSFPVFKAITYSETRRVNFLLLFFHFEDFVFDFADRGFDFDRGFNLFA